MDKKSLKGRVGKEIWERFAAKLKNEETVGVLHSLFDYVLNTLAKRIDDIKIDDSRALGFFSENREILTRK